jgi:hypothetical protein
VPANTHNAHTNHLSSLRQGGDAQKQPRPPRRDLARDVRLGGARGDADGRRHRAVGLALHARVAAELGEVLELELPEIAAAVRSGMPDRTPAAVPAAVASRPRPRRRCSSGRGRGIVVPPRRKPSLYVNHRGELDRCRRRYTHGCTLLHHRRHRRPELSRGYGLRRH